MQIDIISLFKYWLKTGFFWASEHFNYWLHLFVYTDIEYSNIIFRTKIRTRAFFIRYTILSIEILVYILLNILWSDIGSIFLKERNIKGELTETFMLFSDKTLTHWISFKVVVIAFVFTNLFIEFVFVYLYFDGKI